MDARAWGAVQHDELGETRSCRLLAERGHRADAVRNLGGGAARGGHSIATIADELGVSQGSVYQYLRASMCPDCGAPLVTPTAKRCPACSARENIKPRFDQEEIERRFGGFPRALSAAGLAPTHGVRRTRRTEQLLDAVAAHPGSSNRELAEACGITDSSHIFILLRRLLKLGHQEHRTRRTNPELVEHHPQRSSSAAAVRTRRPRRKDLTSRGIEVDVCR